MFGYTITTDRLLQYINSFTSARLSAKFFQLDENNSVNHKLILMRTSRGVSIAVYLSEFQ